MTILLDHTIVPARDKEESARFFARIFGLEYQGPVSHFAPVRINDTLTIDFDNWDSFERHHYAFRVSEDGVRRDFRPGPRRGPRLWQRPARRGEHGDQPPERRPRILFSGPERAPARSADGLRYG